jgi:sirohydrochlorin cobaltochelatase
MTLVDETAHAVLLVGHGSRNAAWFDATTACLEVVRAQLGGVRVDIAYLDHHPDRFKPTLAGLIADGFRVSVVPLLMAPGGHLLSDIEGHLEELRNMDPAVSLRLLPTLTEFDEVKIAFALAVQRALTA